MKYFKSRKKVDIKDQTKQTIFVIYKEQIPFHPL